MGKYIKHVDRRTKIGRQELQVMAMLLCVELVMFLYALVKGVGGMYLQIAVVLIPASLIFCLAGFYFKANTYLVIWTVLLMNLGFFTQLMSVKGDDYNVWGTALKCAFAFAVAIATAFLYKRFMQLLSMDKALLLLILVQLGLCVLLLLVGTMVGEKDKQGALISLNVGSLSVQPLEVVKILYIFVTAGLLCKEERREVKLLKLPREVFFIIYTLVLGMWMFLFSELGTFLVMLLFGIIMFFIYSHHRKVVGICALGTGVGAMVGWGLCLLLKDRVDVFSKLYLRVKYVYHPELDPNGAGYHGLLIRKALTVGEAFGPDTNRYLFEIPNAQNDMVFVKLVQTCGFVMGLFVLLGILLLLREGYDIAQKNSDCYFRGLATGIIVLIVVEAALHVAVNVGLMPITGIPLYFCSQGVTSLTTGLMLISVMMVLSKEENERSVYHEESIDNFFRKTKKCGSRTR